MAGGTAARYMVAVPLVVGIALVVSSAVRLVVDPGFRAEMTGEDAVLMAVPVFLFLAVSALIVAAPFWFVFDWLAARTGREAAGRAGLVTGPALVAGLVLGQGVIAPMFGAYGLRLDLGTWVFAAALLLVAPFVVRAVWRG